MKPLNLSEQLRSNPYPGRGIVLGRTVDNKSDGRWHIWRVHLKI